MIYFVTGSNDKFKEANSIVSNLERIDIDLTEIQSLDPKEIIEAKLKEATKHKEEGFVVEDTSLYLKCLNGLPGPLIKWFLKTIGNEGLAKIAEKLDNNLAEAKTAIGYMEKGEVRFFEGSILGKVVTPRGENGFGWDAIFMPDGYSKTFAEMTEEEKNSLSMRKVAFAKLKDFLESCK